MSWRRLEDQQMIAWENYTNQFLSWNLPVVITFRVIQGKLFWAHEKPNFGGNRKLELHVFCKI